MSAEATQIIQDAQRTLKNNALDNEAILESWALIRKFTTSDRVKHGNKPQLKKEVTQIINWRFRDEVSFMVESYNVLRKCETVECNQEHQYQSFYDVVDKFSVGIYLDLKGSKV